MLMPVSGLAIFDPWIRPQELRKVHIALFTINLYPGNS